MCTTDALDVLTFGMSAAVREGGKAVKDTLTPDINMPGAPKPLAPPDAPNKTAEDLWAPAGLKDSQTLAARLGTNALVVPFQTTNLI